jgi:RimJ/RimL family protein N-acetyltransferase
MKRPDPGALVPEPRLEDVAGLPEAPALGGGRLVLEPLRTAHVEEMGVALSDPGLYRYTGGSPPTEDDLRARYERQVKGRSPAGEERWFNWVVRELGGEAVGYVQATVHVGRDGAVADLAWVIGAPYQGCGFAKSAAEMMKQWLRQQGVQNFTAHVHPEHLASAAVAAHLGLTPTRSLEGGEVIWAETCERPG